MTALHWATRHKRVQLVWEILGLPGSGGPRYAHAPQSVMLDAAHDFGGQHGASLWAGPGRVGIARRSTDRCSPRVPHDAHGALCAERDICDSYASGCQPGQTSYSQKGALEAELIGRQSRSLGAPGRRKRDRHGLSCPDQGHGTMVKMTTT